MNKERFQIVCQELSNLDPADPERPGELEPLENGNYALRLPGGNVIGLFFNEELGCTVLIGSLGALPDDPATALEVGKAFLGGNLLWIDSGEYTFALDEAGNHLVLQARYAENDGLIADLISKIRLFSEDAGRLAGILQQMIADLSPGEDRSPDLTPPDEMVLANFNLLI